MDIFGIVFLFSFTTGIPILSALSRMYILAKTPRHWFIKLTSIYCMYNRVQIPFFLALTVIVMCSGAAPVISWDLILYSWAFWLLIATWIISFPAPRLLLR